MTRAATESNHRNQVRILLCTKLARAPVQTKAHLNAQSETTTATTQQRHPAHANPPELIPARPPRPGAAHRGHRNSQTPRESTGAAQQDASGQPNAPMLPQRATTATKCGPFSAPSSPAPPCKQKLIFTHPLAQGPKILLHEQIYAQTAVLPDTVHEVNVTGLELEM